MSWCYIQVGGNDVDNTDTMVQAISIASEIEELALKLINEFCVKLVFIGEIVTRKRPKKTSPSGFAQRREATMKYLETIVQHEPRIRIWRHKRIFGSEQEMFDADGIHVNSLGQQRFNRSLRLAIKTAVDQLDGGNH